MGVRRAKEYLSRKKQMEEKWADFPVPNDWKHGYAVSNFGRVRKNGRHWANHKLLNLE